MAHVSDQPVRPPHASLTLALLGAVLGAALGAAVGGGVRYLTLTAGVIGPDALVAGWITGIVTYRLGKGESAIYGVVAGVLGAAAAVGAVLLWLPLGTGKSYARLFSEAEVQATRNTLMNTVAYGLYALGGAVAYFTSWRRAA